MVRVGLLLVLFPLVALGCDPATTYEFPAASARPALSAPGSSSWAIPAPPDPAVSKLATDVVNTCGFAAGAFRGDCAALRKWLHPETNAFQGHRADATIVDLLGSADERMRVLAAQRQFWDEAAVLGDRETAERLIGFAERADTNAAVRARLLDAVLKLDFAKLGLGERLKQFVARADASVRQDIPAKFLRRATPIEGVLELVGGLLKDPEESVRQAAFRELVSLGSDSTKRPAVCKVLTGALDPAVESTDDLMTSFSGSTGCVEAPPKFVDRIEAAMKTPKTVSQSSSRLYPTVLRGICIHGGAGFDEADAPTKKRAFDAARAIAKTKGFDVYAVRAPAIDAMVACDPAAAPAALQKLMQDPNPVVDQLAKDGAGRPAGAAVLGILRCARSTPSRRAWSVRRSRRRPARSRPRRWARRAPRRARRGGPASTRARSPSRWRRSTISRA
ncbi:MAG: hypothetical protein U0414_23270 [Polyangiaceae bacterium]